MDASSLNKGKIIFQFLLIILIRWATITCQLNFYHTDEAINSNSLQYNCLNYRVHREKPAYSKLLDMIDGVIPYCFRPVYYFERALETSANPLSQKLSFEQLRLAHTTPEQLISWSSSIDVTQRYRFYLNEPNAEFNEDLYNCTEPWFGPWYQYSFLSGGRRSFN
ncbi:unnamed protein product [Adineta steineri]|uniref:Uncharacterized protein n=1 Tax=Adineta steineri TaxID=433720 RepID=A0A819Y5I1_9BILA|nr:unnamed protein product [Adineta steineri]CAF4151021.1 unnamed protein product [Adineta steineri]